MKWILKNAIRFFNWIACLIVPNIVFGHTFGRLYSLPIPFWLYLYGASITMLLSFLIIGYFFKKKDEESPRSKYDLSGFKFVKYLDNFRVIKSLRLISFLIFVLTISTGLVGNDSFYLNFNMTFFWIVFVSGLTYVTFIFGDIFKVLNPWKILTNWLVGENQKPWLKYPTWLGYYPALLFYFVFIWIELVGGVTPFKLSVYLIVYTVINDVGVLAFGKEFWFRYCEFFSVFFNLISKMSVIQYESRRLFLRIPFTGLLDYKVSDLSLLTFIIFMLSSTAFDGFKETLFWSKNYWENINDSFSPIFGESAYKIFETFGILFSLIMFILIYFVFIYISKLISKSERSIVDFALIFATSLIPIAFAYNIAHYYTLIFTEGPNILRLISDPFGFGWNLFLTADYYTNIIIPANFIWHSEVALILIGHIVAVYLSHKISINIFTGKRAILSQFPMLVLMILYTIVGLWILSAPLTA